MVKQDMRLFTTDSKRLPMVWFLSGLLFNAVGLYLGFEYSISFVLMLVGWVGCALGLVLFVLQLMEPPKQSAATRLSPKFISAGSTDMMPAMPNVDGEQAPE